MMGAARYSIRFNFLTPEYSALVPWFRLGGPLESDPYRCGV